MTSSSPSSALGRRGRTATPSTKPCRSRRTRRRGEPWLARRARRRRAEHPVAGDASRRPDANARSSWWGGSVFWLWVAVVALAVLNTIAKEFVDKQSMGKRARLGWSALIVVVVSVGGILTVTRAVLSGQALAAIEAKYASRNFTDDQMRDGLPFFAIRRLAGLSAEAATHRRLRWRAKALALCAPDGKRRKQHGWMRMRDRSLFFASGTGLWLLNGLLIVTCAAARCSQQFASRRARSLSARQALLQVRRYGESSRLPDGPSR